MFFAVCLYVDVVALLWAIIYISMYEYKALLQTWKECQLSAHICKHPISACRLLTNARVKLRHIIAVRIIMKRWQVPIFFVQTPSFSMLAHKSQLWDPSAALYRSAFHDCQSWNSSRLGFAWSHLLKSFDKVIDRPLSQLSSENPSVIKYCCRNRTLIIICSRSIKAAWPLKTTNWT